MDDFLVLPTGAKAPKVLAPSSYQPACRFELAHKSLYVLIRVLRSWSLATHHLIASHISTVMDSSAETVDNCFDSDVVKSGI